MKINANFVVIFLGILLCVSVNADDPADSKDCKFWHQLAYNLSHASETPGAEFLRLSCNSTCSSLSCSGHLNQLSLPVQIPSDVDFCFGVRLNHCDNPVDMDYYITVPSYNITKMGSISHNDTYEVPAFTKSKAVTMVIVVEMVRVNASYILFGVTGKLKLTLAGIDEFPYSEKVFPPTFIDVPQCLSQGSPKTPFNAPDTCVGPPKPGTTPSPASTVKPVIKSKTLNGPCDFGLEQCSRYEMCQASTKSRGGVCVCGPSSYLDGTLGRCLPNSTTQLPGSLKTTKLPSTTNKPSVTEASKNGKSGTNRSLKPTKLPSTTNKPSVTEASKNGKSGTNSSLKPTKLPSTTNKPSVTEASKNGKSGTNMTPVIIAVFGGLLLIVVVVSVIIHVYICRRRRQASLTGGNQLLMDYVDGDDDV